jgi:2-keto-4-pentenoate hydratase/2-oxohepta-3-ene-1,7-dioic acid hydratase in catechol pathway
VSLVSMQFTTTPALRPDFASAGALIGRGDQASRAGREPPLSRKMRPHSGCLGRAAVARVFWVEVECGNHCSTNTCFYFQNPAAVIGRRAEVPIAPGTAACEYELEVAIV